MSDLLIKEKFEENLKLLEMKSLIPRYYLRIILIISFVSFLTGLLDSFVSCMICLALPMLWSIMALYRKELEYRHWITYWLIYSCLYGLENLEVKRVIPLFHFIKCLVLVYLYFPNTKGTFYLYKEIVHRLPIKSQENTLKIEIQNLLNKRKNNI
jgi:hypothetical protein